MAHTGCSRLVQSNSQELLTQADKNASILGGKQWHSFPATNTNVKNFASTSIALVFLEGKADSAVLVFLLK